MRLKQVTELIKVNMVYANPQMIEAKRNKEAKKGTPSSSPAYMSLVWQNLLMLGLFLFLFGMLFRNINLSQYPGMFTTSTGMFVLMALLQGFYIVYNLFYESRDLVHYLPLPFKEGEIFTAKLVVLLFMMLPYMLPIWMLFFFLGFSSGKAILPLIPGSFLLFVLLTLVVFAFAIVLVHFITKLPVFHKNKQVVTTGLYALSSFGMIAVIFFMSNMEPDEMEMTGQALPDVQVLPFVDVFYDMLVTPADLNAWLGLAGWAALLAVLALVVVKWVIPTFYQEDTSGTTEAAQSGKAVTSQKKMATETKSVNQTLLKYHLGLIQDGTLIMQFLSAKVLLPVIAIGPNLVNGVNLENTPMKLWPVFFFAGFVYTFLTLNAISIVGVIISLERENFLYIKSLPFSLSRYLRFKFVFAFVIEWIIPAALALFFILFARVPLVLGVLFMLGLTLGTLTVSHFYFVRDYRMLHLDWQNLTELFNRGGGTFLQALIIFGSVFGGVLAVVLVTMVLLFSPPVWQQVVGTAVVVLPLLLSIGLLVKYKKTFWPQFEN